MGNAQKTGPVSWAFLKSQFLPGHLGGKREGTRKEEKAVFDQMV